MYRSILVTIAAGGTPQAVITGGAAVPGKFTSCQKIVIQPAPGNAGVGYAGVAGMVVSSLAGVIGVIPKPVSATTGPFAELVLDAPTQLGGMQLALLFLDGTTNDKFIVRFI